MPTSQKVQIDTYDYGASLTAPTLGNPLTGSTITDGTAATCDEQSADSGVYIADYVGADASHLIPAGTYRLTTAVNGKPLKRWVTFTGVDGEVVYARTERTVELDSASLRRFVTEDTGETVAASGSVAKLAQGTGSLSAEQQAQLDLIEVAVSGGQVVATTGFGIPDASGALLLKRGHTVTVTFTSATSNIVSDLSASTTKVYFGVRTVSGNLLISGVEGTKLVSTGLQSVQFTLTAAQALALVAGVHLYDVVCVYGYDSSLTPPYASMQPFTGGYVRVQEVGVDLAEL